MRGILILGMPGLIVGIVISIILSTQFSSKKVFTLHAQSIMQNIASCTIDKARSHLEPARDAALLTNALAVNNIVTSSDVSEMEHYFHEQLLIHSQFSNIYYGTETGEFMMTSRLKSGRYYSKIISRRDGQRTVQIKEMDLGFSPIKEYEDPMDTYDPRLRPWYRKAVEEGALIWTDPYLFYTSNNPGITTASPVYDDQNRLVGVVGVDIEISDLSEFIMTLEIGKNGKAFILDDRGRVIAYPDKSKITRMADGSGTLDLVEIGWLDDEISQAAYNALKELDYDYGKEEELFFTFRHNREAYHAMFAPFRASYWPWLIGIYIPEDDYFGTLKRNRTFMILITLFLGMLTSLIGFLITRSIVFSLERLQNAAEQVGKGQLQEALQIETHYIELDETATVFEMMRSSLEGYSSHMEKMVKNRTEELERKNQELAEEILQRKKAEKELIYARNRADESRQIAEIANKAKNTFLANISHEIRTPLSGIIGYAELMRPDNPKEINARFRETILQESERLIVLINRLLDITKIESGQLTPEEKPFSLRSVVDAAWADVFNRMEEKGLEKIEEIDPDVPDQLLGDAHLLTQILTNLFSNSVKFTHRGSISLRITAAESQSGRINLQFTIQDTGIGISPEKQGEIFRIFYQADNSITRRYGGSGLGLSIVKELTELLGGTVAVKSSVYEGSSFTLSFPFNLTYEGVEEPQDGNARDRALVRFKDLIILLAEDYSVNRDLIRHHLEGTGCRLLTAANGREALDIFRRERPDIILMDIQMPLMDGLEATKVIRKEEQGHSVCIIGVTANAFPQDLRTYWKAGMNDCLVKPFRKRDLFDKLKHWEKFSRMNWVYQEEKQEYVPSVFASHVLMEQVEDNSVLAKVILEGFRSESRNALSLFDQSPKEPPLEDIHRCAHSLKSGSLNIGAYRLAEAASKLEKAAKDQQTQLFEEAIAVIVQEYRIWERTASEWESSLNSLSS